MNPPNHITPVTQPLNIGTPKKGDSAAKGSAIGIAILVHALIFLLLTFIVLQTISEKPVELVVESQVSETPVIKPPKQFTKPAKPNPSAPSMARAMVVASTAPSQVSLVTVEDTDDFEIGMGDDFGAGLGIGAGSGSGGGGVGFFGSRTTAERVVFIVDMSGSLNSKQFDMIKEELTKSLTRLAANIEYQVLFFAGATWFAGDEVVVKGRNRYEVKSGRQEYVWETKGKASDFNLTNRKDLPTAKWKKASKASIHKTKKHVEAQKKLFGTDWEWPLKVALQMEPKPDVVYFLTDGVTGNVKETLEEIKKINRRGGKKSKINTISMMEPRAAADLRQLAKESGGKLTIVNEDGTTTEVDMRGSGR